MYVISNIFTVRNNTMINIYDYFLQFKLLRKNFQVKGFTKKKSKLLLYVILSFTLKIPFPYFVSDQWLIIT